METNTVVEDTNEITESQLNNEGLENVVFQYTENIQIITSESVTRKMTYTPDENIDTEEEMDFDDLTIPGDYSDYDIFEGEKENISLNDEVWVKSKKDIWKGRVRLTPYSIKNRAVNI